MESPQAHGALPLIRPPKTSKPTLGYSPSLPPTPPTEDKYQEHFFRSVPISLPTGILTPPLGPHSPTVLPKVAVIGTGYVGLHLVQAFATAYEVIAFDISPSRVSEVEQIVHGLPVEATSDASRLTEATYFLISVSTLLTPTKSIDTSYIQSAIATVERYAPPGSTVVIESSVAVGMSRELLAPLMSRRGFKCGMSPERVDPGRVYPHYSEIPKVISGLDDGSLSSIQGLYGRVFANLVTVTKPEVAEMTKLYENCQRMMCIAFANEMADACRQLSRSLSTPDAKQSDTSTAVTIDIDPWEVARAAATKPFGYMPYTPSLGVGGHCIPVNPYYLLHNASFPLLKACAERMDGRPARLGDELMAKLHAREPRQRRNSLRPRRQRILIVGMGFKAGQSVLSNSPGRALATHLLGNYNTHVEYADPLVDESALVAVPRLAQGGWEVNNIVQEFDAVVVAVQQPGLDLSVLDAAERRGVLVESYCG